MNISVFKNYLDELGVAYDDDKLSKLNIYYNYLVSENEKYNLTAITSLEDVYLKHFYDSLTICKVIDLNGVSSLCDVGSGAGFPGVVLKIFYPHLKLCLVDSLNKRINFLKDLCSLLNLSDVSFYHMRAEEFALKNRNMYDVVTARAVANLNTLLEYCVPIVKVGGYFIPLRGRDDLSLIKNAMNTLNVNLVSSSEFFLPLEGSYRCILKFRKVKDNLKYPRKFSEIKKKPL